MEASHALSDAFLTLAGIFVFFTYLRPLADPKRLLWSAFILSITTASFFGVIRFLGYTPAKAVSEIFQHVAATLGASCLVLVSYLSISKKPLAQKYLIMFISLSIALFLAVELGGQKTWIQTSSMIAIPLVFALGVAGLIKGKRKFGGWLLLAVMLLVAATFNAAFAAKINLNSVDLYHYLLALSVLCFGKAADKKQNVAQKIHQL